MDFNFVNSAFYELEVYQLNYGMFKVYWRWIFRCQILEIEVYRHEVYGLEIRHLEKIESL